MVVGDGECHQLFERHFVVGIEIEQARRHRGKLEPLLDHIRADEEACRNLFLAKALIAQGLERSELIERMQRDALDVLGERVLLGSPVGSHHAGHRLRLRHPLLLHQEFQRAVAPAAGRNLVHAGLGTIFIEHRPYTDALQQAAAGDVLGQILDRNAGLDAANIGLRKNELVEGNVLRLAQDDLGGWVFHEVFLRDGPAGDTLSTFNPVTSLPPSSNSRPTVTAA